MIIRERGEGAGSFFWDKRGDDLNRALIKTLIMGELVIKEDIGRARGHLKAKAVYQGAVKAIAGL